MPPTNSSEPVSVPVPPTPHQVQPEPQPQPQLQPEPKNNKLLYLIIAVVLIILILAGGVFAYVGKIGPFARAPYKEDNLMTGLLSKFSQIDSSSYKVSSNLYAVKRDSDAKPFDIKMENEKELKEMYYRDQQRAESLQNILSTLKYDFSNKYPASLEVINTTPSNYQTEETSILDPLTNQPYAYKLTENGTDFELTVTYETRNAVSVIKASNKYTDKPTEIKDMTVTFTKDSSTYLYLSNKPPKTFLESLGEYTAYLPPEINVQGSIEATASKKQEGKPVEWKFMLDGSGDFGDLTYKVNVEALKNDEDYYVRINNLPSLMMGFLPPMGQWVKYAPAASSTESDPFSMSLISSESIGEIEDEYAEQKVASVDFLKKLTAFADEEKLFAFKSEPVKEKVGGRSLYRYELKLRKEAILPFYRKLMDEASKNEKIRETLIVDEGYLNYLESEEFSKTFDYYDANTSIALWVDDKGFPAGLKYSVRIVPPDETIALKDKQIMLEFKLDIDDINVPVNIEAPEGAKTPEELDGTNDPFSESSQKAKDAITKSSLSSVRAQSELVYEKSSGYGTKAFPLGPCKQTVGTLFGDKEVYDILLKATDGDVSKATCVSGYDVIKNGVIEKYAVSAPLTTDKDYSYCVDSTGSAKEILGSVKSVICK